MSASKNKPITKEERVAKITARQAIVVALITAAAGLIGAAIQKVSSTTNTAVQQKWLKIRGVELEGFSKDSRVRVVIYVNGIALSYPSRAIWIKVGPQMSEEEFPLPIDTDKYKISFELFISFEHLDQVGSIRVDRSNEVIEVKQTPFKYDYKLYTVEAGIRGNEAVSTIKFEVR